MQLVDIISEKGGCEASKEAEAKYFHSNEELKFLVLTMELNIVGLKRLDVLLINK